MNTAPRNLVIKSLPPGIKGRSLSAAKRAAIVKKVRASIVVKSISRLCIEDSATGSGLVSFSLNRHSR
jgi:hypothetical protein